MLEKENRLAVSIAMSDPAVAGLVESMMGVIGGSVVLFVGKKIHRNIVKTGAHIYRISTIRISEETQHMFSIMQWHRVNTAILSYNR